MGSRDMTERDARVVGSLGRGEQGDGLEQQGQESGCDLIAKWRAWNCR